MARGNLLAQDRDRSASGGDAFLGRIDGRMGLADTGWPPHQKDAGSGGSRRFIFGERDDLAQELAGGARVIEIRGGKGYLIGGLELPPPGRVALRAMLFVELDLEHGFQRLSDGKSLNAERMQGDAINLREFQGLDGGESGRSVGHGRQDLTRRAWMGVGWGTAPDTNGFPQSRTPSRLHGWPGGVETKGLQRIARAGAYTQLWGVSRARAMPSATPAAISSEVLLRTGVPNQ